MKFTPLHYCSYIGLHFANESNLFLAIKLTVNYIIAASSSNIYTKTFDGIDVAGRRLANEVCTR